MIGVVLLVVVALGVGFLAWARHTYAFGMEVTPAGYVLVAIVLVLAATLVALAISKTARGERE